MNQHQQLYDLLQRRREALAIYPTAGTMLSLPEGIADHRRFIAVNIVLTNVTGLYSDWKKGHGSGNRALRRQGKVRCRNCDEVDVIGGSKEIQNGICEDCSEYYVYCRICCCDHHDDHVCRHLFWNNEHGQWDGCGDYSNDEYAHIKPSFWALLDKFAAFDESPYEFALALKSALETHKYQMKLHGFLLSMPTFVCYLGDGYRDWGWRATEDLTDEQHEAMYLGGSWLMTLQAGKTLEPDTLTAKWVAQWMEQDSAKNKQP